MTLLWLAIWLLASTPSVQLFQGADPDPNAWGYTLALAIAFDFWRSG